MGLTGAAVTQRASTKSGGATPPDAKRLYWGGPAMVVEAVSGGGSAAKAIALPGAQPPNLRDRSVGLLGRKFLNFLAGSGIGSAIYFSIAPMQKLPTASHPSDMGDRWKDPKLWSWVSNPQIANNMRYDPQVLSVRESAPGSVVVQYSNDIPPDRFVPALAIPLTPVRGPSAADQPPAPPPPLPVPGEGIPLPNMNPPGQFLPPQTAPEFPASGQLVGPNPLDWFDSSILAPPRAPSIPVQIGISIGETALGPIVKVSTKPVSAAAVDSRPMGGDAKAGTFKAWMTFQTIVNKTLGRLTEVMDVVDQLVNNTYAMTKSGLVVNAMAVEKGDARKVITGIARGEYEVDIPGFAHGVLLNEVGDQLIARFNKFGMKGLVEAGYNLPVGVNALTTGFKRISEIEKGGFSNATLNRSETGPNFTQLPDWVHPDKPTQKYLRSLFK